MNTMNKSQVDALFQREAVLIGSADVVPEFRVAALFGDDAAKHGQRQGNRNGYGAGGYTLMYLTYRGFLAAASFHNVQQLREVAD